MEVAIAMKTVIASRQNKEKGGLQRRLASKERGKKLLLRKMEVILKAARKAKRSKKKKMLCMEFSALICLMDRELAIACAEKLAEKFNFIFLDRENLTLGLKV